MTESNCPRCGGSLAEDAPGGLCPKCLLAAGMASTGFGEPGKPDADGLEPELTLDAIRRDFPALEIVELIGRGGMGVVYKARQPTLDRLVALKVLSPRFKGDPAFAERFLREARALARLNHQNIVGLHDFGQTADRYYLIMEYVDGISLRQALREGSFTPEEALAIVPHICDALQYAHDEGIVHRDIKPENVLIDKKGRVKIADFGLAKLLVPSRDDFTLTGTREVMGTPHYMAPEQMEHPAQVDHRADIYALGVVFYEMLTGELPIGRFATPSQKVHVDVRLDDIVLRTLEREPERRYQKVSQVKTDIETLTCSAGSERQFAHAAAAAPPRTKKCAFCAEQILHDATVCRYCGRSVTGRSRLVRLILKGVGSIVAIWLFVVVLFYAVSLLSFITQYGHKQRESKVAQARHDMRNFVYALANYATDQGAFPLPEPMRGNIEAGSLPSILTTPVAYVTGLPSDPFSKDRMPYRYETSGTACFLWSSGPDGDDDITSSLRSLAGKTLDTTRKELTLCTYDPTNGTASNGDLWMDQSCTTPPADADLAAHEKLATSRDYERGFNPRPPDSTGNVLRNGGFEDDIGAIPGTPSSWGLLGPVRNLTADGLLAHTGRASGRIAGQSGVEGAAAFAQQVDTADMATSVRLSGWLRMLKAHQVFIDVRALDGKKERALWRRSGTAEWEPFSLDLALAGSTRFVVTLSLVGEGAVWFDDLRLELTGAEAPEQVPQPAKDAEATTHAGTRLTPLPF